MRVILNLNPTITDDAEGYNSLFALDATRARATIDNMQHMTSGHFSIAVSSTEVLSLGDVADVRFVYVRADSDFDISFDAGTSWISVRLASSTATYCRFAAEIDVPSVRVRNNSASNVVDGLYCFYGDPEA